MEAPQRLSSECGKQEIPGLVGTVGDAEDKSGNGPPTKRRRQLLSSLSGYGTQTITSACGRS